jgi:tetratricopeptide (TPR) repeat protein
MRLGRLLAALTCVVLFLGAFGGTWAEDHSPDAAEQRWNALTDQALQYYKGGQYQDAEQLEREALEMAEGAFGPEHLNTAEALCNLLSNLAVVLGNQGRHEEEERLLRRALAIWEKVLGPQHPYTAAAIYNLAGGLGNQGRYREAETLNRRALAIIEKAFGPEHPDTAYSLNSLARILEEQGRYAEAEPLDRRALAIREKTLGPEHPDTAESLNNLAEVLRYQGRLAEAEPFHRRAHAIWEKALGPEHPSTALSLNNRAMLLRDQGRFEEAKPLFQRALAIREKTLGPEHPLTAQSLHNLAFVLNDQGRYREAEPLVRRALAIAEKALGPEHPDTVQSLNVLAMVLEEQGRYGEAEPLFRRALVIWEKVLGPQHPYTAGALNNLAAVVDAHGRHGEAEPLYRQSLAIREKVLGPEHPSTALSLNNLAMLLKDQGRYGEAEPLFRRALAIWEAVLGPEHPDTATALDNLASVLDAQGRHGEVEALQRRALAIREKVLGAEHPNTAQSLNNLAGVLADQGRYGEAEPLFRRAVAVSRSAQVPANLLVASANLGGFLVAQDRPEEALPYYREAANTLDRLFAYTQGLPEEARLIFLGRYAYIYRRLLHLLLRLHHEAPAAGYDRELLAVASRDQSRLFSELLRQADVEWLSADPPFLALKDRRQALYDQLAALREQRARVALSAPDAESRKAALDAQVKPVAAELARVEQRLWVQYPRFMELLQPRPVTVEQLQQDLLRPGEAVLTFVVLGQETVVMVVTRERFALHVAKLSEPDLTARVRPVHALAEQVAARADTSPLKELDPAGLHALYRDLIAPVEESLQGAKRVLVVGDRALYILPLELVVTRYGPEEKGAFEAARRAADGSPKHPLLQEYGTLSYLGDRHRFSYLPSLAALVSQRRYAKPLVPATRDLIAFADPVFGPEDTASPTEGYSPPTRAALDLLARSGAGPVLRRLPESAEEARAIAQIVGGKMQLYLRAKAQEHTAKTVSMRGLHYLLFSTHGLLGGEFLPPATAPEGPLRLEGRPAAPEAPRGQPALALTLVGDLQGEDGLLTLQEVIEGLDLNTDLVVLSACHTAGATEQAEHGEGFAGLTRAFLFAGARRLVVSHWSVESLATRDLMTAFFQELIGGEDPVAALATARKRLRATPLPLEQGAGHIMLSRTHPYFWAPFVVVGD